MPENPKRIMNWKDELLELAIESGACKKHCRHGAMYMPPKGIGNHGWLAREPNVFAGKGINEKFCCYCGVLQYE